GDKALTQVATRLYKLGMPCYRIGGDEFALMAHNRDLDASWQQIEACFKSEVNVGHQKTAKLSTSIGVARFPTDADQLTQLISIADANMYKMKFANQNKSLVV
ncbi:diguanylate cyclase, partial [Vibrio xuii]